MAPVPEIKLIRTDTTLDLSQKAEKVWLSRNNRYYLLTKKQFSKHGEILITIVLSHPKIKHQIQVKKMTDVGFEPTPPKRLVPKTSALDHSANQSYTHAYGNSFSNEKLNHLSTLNSVKKHK